MNLKLIKIIKRKNDRRKISDFGINRKKDKEDEDLIDNEGLLCDLILPESLQRTYKNIIF
jgi:hypothetical protein